MKTITRTERGWAAHLCVCRDCLFRRNTLLECGEVRVIVSTVGNYIPQRTNKLETIGCGRHYETFVFNAIRDGLYWDVSGSEIDSDGMLGGELDSDLKADAMHERMVDNVTKSLSETGEYERIKGICGDNLNGQGL